MDGMQEVPTKGDPDGRATGTFTLDPAKGTAYWVFVTSKIETPLAAHIHKGAKGKAGDVVIAFFGRRRARARARSADATWCALASLASWLHA